MKLSTSHTRRLVYYSIFIICGCLYLNPPAHLMPQYAFQIPAASVVHRQFNFHVVEPGLWRSAQPSKESLQLLKEYGLKTIVNLRRHGEAEIWEKDYAKEMGVHYLHFPMNAHDPQDAAYLRRILDAVENPKNRPLLIHCAAGKDRTGLISALYRMEKGGLSLEDAQREMLMYGYDVDRLPYLKEALENWVSRKSGTKER